MRPSLAAVLIFAAGVPLTLALVVINPAFWPFGLEFAGLILAAMLLDALATLRKGQIGFSAQVPARIYLGETARLTLTFGPTRHRRDVAIELLLNQTGSAAPQTIVTTQSSSDAPWTVTMPVVPHQRGRLEFESVSLRWRSSLRLVETVTTVPIGQVSDVVPNVRGLYKTGLAFLAEDAQFGIKAQRQKGEGSEFVALRDYVPGLDHRFIDWKRSAKHRRLVSKEFETKRNHQIVLAFDTGHLMLEPINGLSRLDHAINAGLLLTWVSLKCGDLVGSYAFDAAVRHYTPPGRGMNTFARIQHASAGITYHPYETNFTLGLAEINVRLKRRALIVLFTDFVDSISAEILIDSIGHIANRHALMFVTLRDQDFEAMVDKQPETFTEAASAVIAQDFLQERAVVFERLNRMGVACLDVTVGGLSVSLLNRYMAIKKQGLIG